MQDRDDRDDRWDSGEARDAAGSETGGFPIEEEEPCADENPVPGDVMDENVSEDRSSPGTVDDVPYSLDENHPGEKPVLEPLASGDEEEDLWNQQKQLIDEDEAAGYRVEGANEEDADEIMEALADDASEEAQGESATGMGSEPDHGGFPERE